MNRRHSIGQDLIQFFHRIPSPLPSLCLFKEESKIGEDDGILIKKYIFFFFVRTEKAQSLNLCFIDRGPRNLLQAFRRDLFRIYFSALLQKNTLYWHYVHKRNLQAFSGPMTIYRPPLSRRRFYRTSADRSSPQMWDLLQASHSQTVSYRLQSGNLSKSFRGRNAYDISSISIRPITGLKQACRNIYWSYKDRRPSRDLPQIDVSL